MRERGDFTCLHEPFMYYYYVHLAVKTMPHFDADPSRPAAFDDVIAHVFGKAQFSPVFFKDMSYYVVPTIFQHEALARRLTHVFLIRDPRKSMVSYYKLDRDLRLDEIGLEAQWRHVQWLNANSDEPPMVIEAEAIQRNPKGVMGLMWEALGLSFIEHAFEWDAENAPDEWQQVAGWHQTAANSRRIEPTPEEDEATIRSAFDKAAADAPYLRDHLDHHWPFYQRLKELASRD